MVYQNNSPSLPFHSHSDSTSDLLPKYLSYLQAHLELSFLKYLALEEHRLKSTIDSLTTLLPNFNLHSCPRSTEASRYKSHPSICEVLPRSLCICCTLHIMDANAVMTGLPVPRPVCADYFSPVYQLTQSSLARRAVVTSHSKS